MFGDRYSLLRLKQSVAGVCILQDKVMSWISFRSLSINNKISIVLCFPGNILISGAGRYFANKYHCFLGGKQKEAGPLPHSPHKRRVSLVEKAHGATPGVGVGCWSSANSS